MSANSDVNQKILRILQRDGRISNTELAQRVGLSASACLRRVQELERTGVIKGYRAIIDPAAVGGGVTIFVTVGLSDHLRKDAAAFEKAMAAAPQVRECHNITGSVEYLLRIEVADLDAYKSFHAEVLGAQSQVRSITSHICLSSSKDDRA
ncbi:MAG: Lrp/AsnC family transcriptional regulator [Pseudomonadota bacterium]